MLHHAKLDKIYRLRLELEERQRQLDQLTSEMLEEILAAGPINDSHYECFAERCSDQGRIIYQLRIHKRRKPAISEHKRDLLEIRNRFATVCYAIAAWSAAVLVA